jgi:hypothetical protein
MTAKTEQPHSYLVGTVDFCICNGNAGSQLKHRLAKTFVMAMKVSERGDGEQTSSTYKRVRFSSMQRDEPGSPVPSDDRDAVNDDTSFSSDDNCFWWSAADLKYFKWRMISAAKEALRHPIWRTTLRRIYKANGGIPFFARSEANLFDALQTVKVDPVLLSLWYCEDESAKHSHRGLEKCSRVSILRKNGAEGQLQFISKSSYYYRQMVLSNQNRFSPERLRRKCLKMSRQDRIFARVLGAADAKFACQKFYLCSLYHPAELNSSVELGKQATDQFKLASAVFNRQIQVLEHQSTRSYIRRQICSKQA